MVNREHMEQWINALEAYDQEPARGMLRFIGLGGKVYMCAMGIGMEVMEPDVLVQRKSWAVTAFPAWLGLERGGGVPLKSDGSGYDHVVAANDQGRQSPWTIAQRLRETYLKEES